MARPNNVPSSIGVPGGAPGSSTAIALYLSQAITALNNWVAQAANAINSLLTGAQAQTGGGTIAAGGFIFVNNTTGAAITLTLAAALTPYVVIKDAVGNANLYPITITFSGGIDGATSTILATPYQWIWLAWNGNSYSVVG